MTTICPTCLGHGLVILHRPQCHSRRAVLVGLPLACSSCASSVETCSACNGRGVLGSQLPPGARYGLAVRGKP